MLAPAALAVFWRWCGNMRNAHVATPPRAAEPRELRPEGEKTLRIRHTFRNFGARWPEHYSSAV